MVMARRRSGSPFADAKEQMAADSVKPTSSASATVTLKRFSLRCQNLFHGTCSRNLKWTLALLCLVCLVVLAFPAARRLPTREGDVQDQFLADDSQNELLQALHELPLPATYQELDALNAEFEDLDPLYILRWAAERLGPRLAQVTSFGPTGLVILHLISQCCARSVPIITMDTLYLFPER